MTDETIERTVNELNEELEQLNERRSKVMDTIENMQDMCNHSYVYDGHDSRDDIYKCEFCGATDWR